MKYMLTRQALVSALITMALVFVVFVNLGRIYTIELKSRYMLEGLWGMALSAVSTTLILLAILALSGSGGAFGVTAPIRRWGRRWWLPTLAMTPIIIAILLRQYEIGVNTLVFSWVHAVPWAVAFLCSGFFEETFFRGTVFLILYRAWGQTRFGLHKAAAAQAIMFGALHSVNLVRSDLSHVVFQICFATLIGYGFAGLVAYSRSLWPAIALHGAFNAAGSIASFFGGPGYVFPIETLRTMACVVGVFFLFGAIPGYFCLNRAPLSNDRLAERSS